MSLHPPSAQQAAKQLSFYRRLSLLLLAAAAAAYGVLGYHWMRENAVTFGLVQLDARAPLAKDVERVIKPLRYSLTPLLARADVDLHLDFANRRWSLRNLHRFNGQGQLTLEDGRYGVCGQLSAHAHAQLKPLLAARGLDLAYIRVAQAGYFPAYITEHIALEVTDPSTTPPRTWILDPSLKRYGAADQFEDYLVFERIGTLPFLESRSQDESFRVGAGTPIEITGSHLIFLAVEHQGGVFDPDNFRISLVATHGYRYLSRPLLLMAKVNGEKEVRENLRNVRRALRADAYALLKTRLLELFDRL